MKDLLVAVADVIITLDDNYIVIGVTDPMNIDNLTLWKWTGRKVIDVVSSESVPKLSRILREEAPGDTMSGRWRHINFVDAAGGNLPLLVKYFHLSAGPVTTRLIVGRDLRPIEEVQQRFQKALDEMAPERASDRAPAAPPYDPTPDFDELLGRKPFDEIVDEATQILQRTFFTEALRRANGDSAAAAMLLGLDEAEFLRRLRQEGAN
ncbi:MAG: hypothetical protein ACK4MV_03040 [Beijerinckiaceae bacterium]